MNFKKELSGVAAEVAKIMEAEFSKKQKEIAKMSAPHDKIDAGDLAKLRAGHKPVKEETVTESDLPKGHSKDQKTVTLKHKTSGKEVNVVDAPSVREKYKNMGYHPMKEGIEDKIEAAREKAAAAGKPMKEPKKTVSAKRKVEGPHYGGGKQKDEVEESTNLPFTSMLEAYDANGLAAFVRQEEIVAEGDAYDKDRYAVKNGKAVKDNPTHMGSPSHKDQPHHVWATSAEEALQKKMKEEVDNETFKKEVADQKASMEGKKKQPSVAAASTQGVKQMPEEVETLDEGSMNNMSLSQLMHKHAHVYSPAGAALYKKGRQEKAQDAIEKHVEKKYGTRIKNDMDTHSHLHSYHVDGDEHELSDKEKQSYHKIRDRYELNMKKEEVEQIEERTLSEPETKKKEEYVKGMKKKLSGFKQRYGERAKEVIYATATKMAKKD